MRKRTRRWNDIKIDVERVKEVWKKYMDSNNEQNRTKFHEIRDRVNKFIRKAKKESWRQYGEDLNSIYKNINRIF